MPPSARCRRQPTHTPREQAANIIGAHNAGIRRPRKHPGCRSTDTVTRLLQPQRQHQQPRRQARASGPDLGHLARWVAARPEGNRNAGLFWAANRALEADPAADLSLLADAARQAGLADPEITRTLDSARRTAHPDAGYEPEAGDER